jgi:hypothetical protein
MPCVSIDDDAGSYLQRDAYAKRQAANEAKEINGACGNERSKDAKQ